jgi:hypothetical protein
MRMSGLKFGFWAAVLAFLVACGGGSGSGSSDRLPVASNDGEEESGQIILAITDAEGDFASYTVTVASIVLERADGTVVETLPMSTVVDFAELTEVTELLTVATVPVGRYRQATLRLDYTNATIIVQDDAGGLHDALVQDESGAPITMLEVSLELMDADAIVIRPGVPAAFSLDFDLDASNEIDLSAAPPIVTVAPFLLASAELEADRSHRLRGILSEVDEAAETVTLNVRPLRHRRGQFGMLSFAVNDATLYEVDGATYQGADGLAALSALTLSDAEFPVVAGGLVEAGELIAETVLAGSSVPWTAHDVARGSVVARSGDALTLSGVVVEYADGLIARRDRLTLILGEDTTVTALGLANDTLSKDSVSVGQRVTAFGALSDDTTLDVSDGRLRMNISQLTADVLATDSMVLDLHLLNARRPEAFDFTGTGVDADQDADPAAYEVDTTGLALADVEEGDLVRVRGHVNGFGEAPADFLALSVFDLAVDDRGAALGAVWQDPRDPTAGISSDRIGVDLTLARSILKVRGVPVDGTNPLESVDLVAPESGRGIYAVAVRGGDGTGRREIHLYRSFADLADEVLRQLQAGNGLRFLSVHGRYARPGESGAGELTAARASFEFVGIN